ncbi:OB-fold nucleic acid binding domain-containing protein [Yimella sp. cx-51]|uniref:OB-fold nucleic acid binding domain-containing protein n=1 Tax=Yimella sp. cx-51 TaxID=2770551 RepID=UPI00165DDB83|nr:OB-fold nucleic acid binding domain-containing protein [Yimella sp. cx-51]MBC9957655.1 OB-fold nucleic acid binding domain-containing protein [Yimella sp. cx-51]QTH36990.1 OB-fold nucleic acid binding domain-containing protein [Yimella sp. cx-51]
MADSMMRRLARRLSGADVTGAPETAPREGGAAASRIAELADREMAHCVGTVTSVGVRERAGGTYALVVDLDDGSRVLSLVWLGRKQIGGIEPGARLGVDGRVSYRRGTPIMFNPRYELLPVGKR